MGVKVSVVSVHRLLTLLLWAQVEAAHLGGRAQGRKASLLRAAKRQRQRQREGEIGAMTPVSLSQK